MKDKLLEFIKIKTPSVQEIESYELVDYDGDHGFSGENYIVNCIIAVADTSIPVNNLAGRIKKTCLVNVKALENYIKKEDFVKWL